MATQLRGRATRTRLSPDEQATITQQQRNDNVYSPPNPRQKKKVRTYRLQRLCAASLIAATFLLVFLTTSQPYVGMIRANNNQPDWATFRQDYTQRYQREPPAGLRQWLEFAKAQRCETMKNFYDGIDRDLAYYRQHKSALSMDQIIPEATQYTAYYIAFSLENNVLTVERGQRHGDEFLWRAAYWMNEHVLQWALGPLVQHKPPITAKFVFNLHDEPVITSQDRNYPIFSSCHAHKLYDNLFYHNRTTNSGAGGMLPRKPSLEQEDGTEPRDIALPFIFGMTTYSRGLWFWPFYHRGKEWQQRKDAIVWRGSATGIWLDGPRFHLIKNYGGTGVHPIAPDVPVDADFAFVNVSPPGVKNKGKQPLDDTYRRAERMTYEDLQEYKYVLDVDGNSFTERFPKLLRSGSLVFKSTMFREWHSERLEPWEDFIPVNYDLSDLAEKVKWAYLNPGLAEQIARHGRETVERHLRPEDQQCYIYRFMVEYAAIFDNDKSSRL